MSDSEDQEVIKDDFQNDTMDFDLDDNVDEENGQYSFPEEHAVSAQPVSIYKSGRISPAMSVITEETTVDMRKTSSMDGERFAGGVSPIGAAEKSAFADTFGASFGGTYVPSNMSAEFASGNNPLDVIAQAQNRMNDSALNRLEIPTHFDYSNYEPQNSWDKGPASCNLGFDNSTSPASRDDHFASQSSQQPLDFPSKGSLGKVSLSSLFSPQQQSSGKEELEKSQETGKKEDSLRKENSFPKEETHPSFATPVKRSPAGITTTPVRPRPKSFTRRETEHVQQGVVSSTPKITKGSSALPIDFGDISAINAANNTLNSTVGDQLSQSQLSKAIVSIGPRASIDQLMEQLESLRLQKKDKQISREKSVSFAQPRPPLREKPQPMHVVELPARTTHMDGTLFQTSREVSYARPEQENRVRTTSASSFHSHQNTRTAASSRIANSDTMSDMFSRPSSSASSASTQDCFVGEGAYRLMMNHKFLCFGYIDVGSQIQHPLILTNRGHMAVSLKLTLRKYDAGYKILSGQLMQLEPGAAGQAMVEFKPTTNMKHNNFIQIENVNTGELYKVYLRGTGGTPSIAILQKRETIARNRYGVYLLKPTAVDGSLFLKLHSNGKRRAFCHVTVYADQQPLNCQILPQPNVVLKPGMEMEIEIRIDNIERYLAGGNLRTSTNSLESASYAKDSRLQISVFWGDETQRLRMKGHFAKKTDHVDEKMAPFLGSFKNEKPVDEPPEHPFQKSDIKIFQIGLSKAEIVVSPFAMLPSNFEDCDMTMTSEHTYDRSILNERTLVPDGDLTVVPPRR